MGGYKLWNIVIFPLGVRLRSPTYGEVHLTSQFLSSEAYSWNLIWLNYYMRPWQLATLWITLTEDINTFSQSKLHWLIVKTLRMSFHPQNNEEHLKYSKNPDLIDSYMACTMLSYHFNYTSFFPEVQILSSFLKKFRREDTHVITFNGRDSHERVTQVFW